MVLQCFPTLPGDAPPLPQNFDARYKPPPHREYPSNVKNAHPRDARLQFLEEHHIYLRDGGTPSRCARALCLTDYTTNRLRVPNTHTDLISSEVTVPAMQACMGEAPWIILYASQTPQSILDFEFGR